MQFEWGEAKNLENIRKHEIDFGDLPEYISWGFWRIYQSDKSQAVDKDTCIAAVRGE